ncbi:hypothetical protein JCM31185_16620 [Furfurilactobacillus curtus]|uniref:Transposase n=1 Tax=Furfurilactobacillus curtus TaxID=1746200 RepID=A0ABQ5JQS3_9LACO
MGNDAELRASTSEKVSIFRTLEGEVNPQSWTKSNSGGFTMTKYNDEFKAKIVAEYLAGVGSTF